MLATFDLNSDDRINASDAIWADLVIWRDANGDAQTQSDDWFVADSVVGAGVLRLPGLCRGRALVNRVGAERQSRPCRASIPDAAASVAQRVLSGRRAANDNQRLWKSAIPYSLAA